MDEVDGVPTLVVEMRWDGSLARFWPVSLPVAVRSPGWLPEAEANELPLGGPCTIAR